MVNSEVERLSAGKYLLLTTSARTAPLADPGLGCGDGDLLIVWTVADSGKVKRIRRERRRRAGALRRAGQSDRLTVAARHGCWTSPAPKRTASDHAQVSADPAASWCGKQPPPRQTGTSGIADTVNEG